MNKTKKIVRDVRKKLLLADIHESDEPKATSNDEVLFSVTKEQAKKMRAFAIKHTSCQRGAIGGAHTYCFSPTSLGYSVVLKCHCGQEIDVSDYENW